VHDELGQVLSTLRLNISMARTRFGERVPELMPLAQGMTELVDRAIHGVRNVSENLRPAALGMGVHASIKWLCSNFVEQSGIACALDSSDPGAELDETRAIVIFRIVQESLTNVIRHAKARNVRIFMSVHDGNLCVEVKDDGMGFDMKDTRQRKTYGLLGMGERARACGGQLQISSTPGRGTSIVIQVPVAAGKAK
jgi:signal transduction histidine kinase